MINFNYKNKFRLKKSKKIKLWLIEICKNEGSKLNALSIVFGDDNFLLEFTILLFFNDISHWIKSADFTCPSIFNVIFFLCIK